MFCSENENNSTKIIFPSNITNYIKMTILIQIIAISYFSKSCSSAPTVVITRGGGKKIEYVISYHDTLRDDIVSIHRHQLSIFYFGKS